MSASRQTRGVLGGALGAIAAAVTLSFASVASAAGGASSPVARWYVETSGGSCEGERSAFEREIRLACDAVGGSCGVAATPAEAGLRAVLDCSGADGSWSLVTRTVGGTVLATLDLSGTNGDRLREAAVEVARDATPERSLAIETLRFSLAAEQPEPPASRPSHTLGLAVGATVASGTDQNLPSMLGLHLLAGLEVARATRVTMGLAAEAGGSGLGAARAFRGGAGVAFGAPFDPKAPVGFAVEGGLSAISAYPPASAYSDLVALAPNTTVGVYGQGTFLIQWPSDGLRPFAALSASALSEPVHIGAGGELGLAFPLF